MSQIILIYQYLRICCEASNNLLRLVSSAFTSEWIKMITFQTYASFSVAGLIV